MGLCVQCFHCKTHPTLPWPSFVCVCAYIEREKRKREGGGVREGRLKWKIESGEEEEGENRVGR